MSPIPGYCPYQAGDRVQMHGYPGYHVHHGHNINDLAVIGFRGTVTGYSGGTILTGTTDDGRTWMEPWGHVDPDGTPCGSDGRCGCCPHSYGRRCEPGRTDANRARQAARAMADWWRNGAGRPADRDPHTRGLLFDVEVS